MWTDLLIFLGSIVVFMFLAGLKVIGDRGLNKEWDKFFDEYR